VTNRGTEEIAVARGRVRLIAAVGILAVVGAGVAVTVVLLSRSDPLSVVRGWSEARNAGDVDRAMSYVADEGNILGIGVHLPGERDRLRSIFEAQALASWSVEDSDCVVAVSANDPAEAEVTCRYVQRDRALDRWGVTLVGTHEYVVRNGLIVRALRTHDADSQRSAYAVFDAFRAWVRDTHPELFDVIWVDRTSALYTTPDGARTVLDLLDEYQPPR
jgi:hypothetical protein